MNFARRFLIFGILLTLPTMAFAQEATLTGTVTDATSAVLPGVTVTALLEATGNRFVAVTDELGRYRIPLRVAAMSSARSCRAPRPSRALVCSCLSGRR